MLSIEPILAVAGVRDALARCAAPVMAVSPIIGGRAVKGATAKIMAELGLPVSAAAVADRYRHLLDGYVIDDADAACVHEFGLPVTVTRTLMRTPEDQDQLARHVLASADALTKAAA
jgi:LPPG:FO 2-phospho-L-lactate transferase